MTLKLIISWLLFNFVHVSLPVTVKENVLVFLQTVQGCILRETFIVEM